MKKSIGRTLAHIDVAADTSVRIHEDFFNSHSSYHHLSQIATMGQEYGEVDHGQIDPFARARKKVNFEASHAFYEIVGPHLNSDF